MPIVHKVYTPFYPVAGRLIAGSQHTERGVITIETYHALRFFQQITVDGHATTQLDAVIGPGGTLWLQVEAQLVGSAESRLRRAIGMEAKFYLFNMVSIRHYLI